MYLNGTTLEHVSDYCNQRTNSPVTLTWSWAGREILHFFTISNIYIAPGHGHTTTCYKFWQHFKAFIIPIILYQFQKDHVASFYSFHTCIYSPRARGDNLGDNFLDGSILSLIIGCMFQKICLPFDFMDIFS